MFSISTQSVAESSGGDSSTYMNRSGIYEVIINFASVQVSPNGAESVAFNVTCGDTTKTFYGPVYKKNDGSDNPMGIELYSKLGVIAGMGNGQRPTTETTTRSVGYPPKDKELTTIVEFENMPVYIQLKEEYSKYQEQIKDRMNIVGFFRAADGATAQEIDKNKNLGNRIKVTREKYANSVTYRDGLTKEDVAKWREEKRNNNEDTMSPTPKPAPATKRPVFGG
jgi:hypothetical protein